MNCDGTPGIVLIHHAADQDVAGELHGVGAGVEEDDERNRVHDEDEQSVAKESGLLRCWCWGWLLGTPARHGAKLGTSSILDNVRCDFVKLHESV